MKQKRLYEEARIDVIRLSSKSQLLAESLPGDPNVDPMLGMARYNYDTTGGGFFEE